MRKYSVEAVFDRVLKREMDVLITEKEKQCQSGAVIDLATNRLIEAYYLKAQFDDMRRSRDFERDLYAMEKSERERYQQLLTEERAK